MFNSNRAALRNVQNSRNAYLRQSYLALLLILLISLGSGRAHADTEGPVTGKLPGISNLEQAQTPDAAPSTSIMTPSQPQQGVLKDALPEFLGSLAASLILAVATYLLKRAVVRYRRQRRSRPTQDRPLHSCHPCPAPEASEIAPAPPPDERHH